MKMETKTSDDENQSNLSTSKPVRKTASLSRYYLQGDFSKLSRRKSAPALRLVEESSFGYVCHKSFS